MLAPEGGGLPKGTNLIPRTLRGKFIIAFGAFKAMFCIVVLRLLQRCVMHRKGSRLRPGTSHPQSQIPGHIQSSRNHCVLPVCADGTKSESWVVAVVRGKVAPHSPPAKTRESRDKTGIHSALGLLAVRSIKSRAVASWFYA